MSAEYLRETARMIRETAQAATPGPWVCYGDHLVWPSLEGPAANDPILATMGGAHQESATHIASWHPDVALAVADWLTSEADMCNEFLIDEDECVEALAVARAWRGDA